MKMTSFVESKLNIKNWSNSFAFHFFIIIYNLHVLEHPWLLKPITQEHISNLNIYQGLKRKEVVSVGFKLPFISQVWDSMIRDAG